VGRVAALLHLGREVGLLWPLKIVKTRFEVVGGISG
jgi:hypothetical protein